MFERAVIAVDVHSKVPLLSCAPDLARWGVERLTLLHLIKAGYGEGPLVGEVSDSRQALEESAEELRTEGFDVEVVVDTTPDVGAAIVEFGADFDLIVAGTRSLNLLEELVLGSVVRKVLRNATVPVLLQWVETGSESDGSEPGLACTDTLRHVLLATDLLEGSTAAHEAAVALAARGATVDCVHVMEPEELAEFAERETMVSAALGRLQERIEKAGGSGEALVKEGEPVWRLLEIAAARDASLFVVGRRGRNWPKSMLGTTARKLCERAGISVLLVPRSEE